jgi:cytochrome P450
LHDEVQHVFDAFASRRDGESHVAIRNSAHRAFTPRRIAQLEVSAAGYARELVDEMVQQGGVVDLMDFAYRLPLRIITDLLGVAEEDRDSVHQWSTLIGGAIGATDSRSMSRAHEGLRELRGYIDRLLAQHRQGGSGSTTDLVGLLLAADESGRMGEHELTGMYLQLLFAGHETTTNLIGIGMSELLGNPAQWSAIVERPELVGGAVEELLRYVSPVQFLGRVALRDTMVAGTPVEQGQSVTLLLAAANRDPRRWSDPETVRVSREDASDHLAFGRGRHFCLGASLARLEGRIAISELATRLGHMRPVEQTRTWSGGAMLRHLDQLLVDIGPARS